MIKPALSLIVAAVLAVVATLVAPAVGAKEPPKGTSSITLPEKPNEIPAFVAGLDDKQARSTLVKVLEERTKPAEAEKLDLFAARRFAAAVAGRWRRRRQPPQGALERLVGRAPQRPALLLAQGVELVHAHPRRLGDRTHRLLRLDVAAPVIGDFFGREPLAHV